MAPLPITAALAELADNPKLTPEERSHIRGALQSLGVACDVATRWGYDDAAAMRVRVFRDAVAREDLVGVKRIEMGLALDELCRTLGVPLEGRRGDGAEAC